MDCQREDREGALTDRRTPLIKEEDHRTTFLKRGTFLTTLLTSQTTPLSILLTAGGQEDLVEMVVEEVIPGEAEFGTSSHSAGVGGAKAGGRARKKVTRGEAGGRKSKEGGGGGA